MYPNCRISLSYIHRQYPTTTTTPPPLRYRLQFIYAMRFDQLIYGAQENCKTKLIRSSNSISKERNQTTFFLFIWLLFLYCSIGAPPHKCNTLNWDPRIQIIFSVHILKSKYFDNFSWRPPPWMTALICCLTKRRWILSVRHTNRHCIRSLLYRPRIYLLRWGHKLHYLRKDWDDEKHVKDVFVALLLYECPKTLFRDPTISMNMWIIY